MSFLKKSVLFALASVFALCSVGCSKGGGVGEEKDDPTRTQLYVFNYNGGYGEEWLAKAKERYEELNKDVVYEEGKKGVQIKINNSKSGISSSSILGNKEEVYFTENVYYYSLMYDNVLGDITDAVAQPNPYETDKKVIDKFTDEQKAFYGIAGDDGKTHYYGVPHYSGTYGLIYNKELFDLKGYYFKDDYDKNGTLEDKFIYDPSDRKSVGPDGKPNTDDDGLPATYEEFFWLCDYIHATGNTPVCWTGHYYTQYLGHLINALAADYEGVDRMMLNYTFYGWADDLGKIVDGEFVFDSEPTKISESNGWELRRQAGVYYALKFVEKLIKTPEYYNADNAFNEAYEQTDAQNDFLLSRNEKVQIAMLIDGMWWQSEATNTFDQMASLVGNSFSAENSDIRWMPFPKANEEKLAEARASDRQNTMFDCLYSLCFMKSNIADYKKPLAMDFINFVNTDASLAEFSLTTNTVKALNYTLGDTQLGQLSPFGRSVVEFKQNAGLVYPYSQSTLYKNNQSLFRGDEYYQAKINGTAKPYPAQAFHVDGTSAEDYFTGIGLYYKDYWNTIANQT